MQPFTDYYEMLGIDPTATTEEIKRAFLDKSFILHPDRLTGAPESARKMAEAELKKINTAYDTLKDQQSRREYDAEWRVIRQKPKPVVDQQVLKFENVKPREPQRATFVIRNLGGHYGKINVSNPDSFVKVVKWDSLSTSDELPLRVEIEAQADEWGKSYSETISVRLDDEETKVTVQLQTAPKPAYETVSPSLSSLMSAPTPMPSSVPAPILPPARRALTNSLFSWMKLLLGLAVLLAVVAVIVTGAIAFTLQLPPLVGANSFVAAVVLLVVTVKITRSERYRWRTPSFGVVAGCALGLFLVMAFSGVQPFEGFKDAAINAVISTYHALVP